MNGKTMFWRLARRAHLIRTALVRRRLAEARLAADERALYA